MIRQTKRPSAKSKTKKDVVQSKAISGKLVVGATVAILVAFLAFGPSDALSEAAAEAVSAVTTEQPEVDTAKLKAVYRQSGVYKRKAHFWRHKRGAGHKYHFKMSPMTQSIEIEQRRRDLWKSRARTEFLAWKKWQRARVLEVRKCARAGFPRTLCPSIIRGASLEGKKRWVFDSNLAWIIRHESGFRPCVRNGGIIDCNYRGGRAYGLFQFLGSTWGGVGCKITSDVTRQTQCGIRYISRRYHSPAGAKNFWLRNHWY